MLCTLHRYITVFYALNRLQHYVLGLSIRMFAHPPTCLFICLFICPYQTWEHDITKTNKSILMQIGTRVLQGSGMKHSTFGIRRLKFTVKFTRCQNRSQRSPLVRFLKNCLRNFNQTWQAHITVNVHCVRRTRQGHTKLKIDLEAWQSCHSRSA